MLSSSSRRNRLSPRRCSTSAVMASRTTSETDRPSTSATVCSRPARSWSRRSSRFLVLPGFIGMVISPYHHAGALPMSSSGSGGSSRTGRLGDGEIDQNPPGIRHRVIHYPHPVPPPGNPDERLLNQILGGPGITGHQMASAEQGVSGIGYEGLELAPSQPAPHQRHQYL